jgi:LuxR family transcriptional regulator, maltose regulon positive regulatory protein
VVAAAYTPLIATKITVPPARPQLVARPRLFEIMEEAARHPLTLISAPAGFGKTTLITTWLTETGRLSRAAWVSLDPDDSDPVQFGYYMTAALQTVEPRVGRAPISLLGSLKPPELKDLMSLLFNEIAAAQDSIVLILDDYHNVIGSDIDASLAFLIERMPENLRVILATREHLPLPLARWRTLHRVVEIELDDLRFSYDEAVQFFRQTMGLSIDSRSARTLEERTEGWIAGLQMAALSLRHRGGDHTLQDTAKEAESFSGRHRYLVEYLGAEVLRRQSDDTRAFLHRTAFLDRLCAPLCDAVAGCADSSAMLSYLDQANMFLIRLDENREWYRYHQLFADYLRSLVPASEQSDLHRKASAWFDTRGFGADAIKHALAAKDTDAAVRLIRSYLEKALSRGDMPMLLSWLDALPESTLRGHSDLAGYKSWLLYLRGQSALGQTYSSVANAVEQGDAPPAHQGMLLAFRAYLALNWSDPKEAIAPARQAVSLLGEGTSFFSPYALCLMGQAQGLSNDRQTAAETLREAARRARQLGNRMMELDALGHLAGALKEQGHLREAILLCREAADQHVDDAHNPLPIAGLVYVPLGILHYELDDLESARQFLNIGINLCHQLGMVYFRLLGKCALAKLQQVCGEDEQAWTTLAAAREVSERPESPRRQRMVAVATADFQLRAGNVEAAARTLEDTRKLAGPATEHETLLRARLLLAEHSPSAAWKVLAGLEESARQQASDGSLIVIQVLQALCKRTLGQRAGALQCLEGAVSLAASAGYRRVFLDEGSNLTAMLEEARHVAPAFVSSLLAPASTDGESQSASGLLEPMSKIELEILKLLDRGLTNQELAANLAMTVGTTKWRMNQIFGKLQVRNRIEALARARQLKLL